MESLTREIEAFEAMREELWTNHFEKWVLVYGDDLIGTYETFQDAAMDAAKRFGRGPYLIRQVTSVPERLPSAALYGKDYAYS